MTFLLTGVPRAGTTLCCNILNNQKVFLALHEPINPSKLIPDTRTPAYLQIKDKVLEIKKSISLGLPIELGDAKQGLAVNNPVGLNVDAATGKRKLQAVRGSVLLKQYIGKNVQLVIKQNALFTALLTELRREFPIVCVVRNPVDVLLSWWTISLPVSRGRLPAGEQNSALLASRLRGLDELNRQFTIYEWFCESYEPYRQNTVRYEDIIITNGQALVEKFNITSPSLSELAYQERHFPEDVLHKLRAAQNHITSMNTFGFYTKQEITDRLQQVLSQQ
ncbi:sulfotransferase [Agaribacter flavus]|uniref:Sulfotransferase n=1 Tax=Agaribacter flavus TaxID=1902781 RepID=A0ABV7FS08_9ALTE